MMQITLDSDEGRRLSKRLMRADAILPTTVKYLGGEVPRHSVQHILLIGCTGVVGPYLLHALLTETEATIHCLVRGKTDLSPTDRVQQALAAYGLEAAFDFHRLHIIEADVGKPQFNLSDEQYNELANTIDMVFHNAAWSNHVRAYVWPHNVEKSDLRETNTLSLKEVLLLASIGKTKYVNFTSSIASINRCDVNGNLVEELPNIQNMGDQIYLGYPQSKFVAEQLLQQAVARGIPCRAFRLGTITGDSQTGQQLADNDHMMLEIKACIQMGVAPNWSNQRNFVAVDVAAKCMVAIGFNEQAPNDAFNMINPTSITWRELIAYLNQKGYSISIVDEQDWLNQLAVADETNALYRFKQGYLDAGGMEKTMPAMGKVYLGQVHVAKTIEALADQYIKYPSTEALFKKYVDYFQRSGFYPNPHTD